MDGCCDVRFEMEYIYCHPPPPSSRTIHVPVYYRPTKLESTAMPEVGHLLYPGKAKPKTSPNSLHISVDHGLIF